MTVPHERGDKPQNYRAVRYKNDRSPHPWGCFCGWVDHDHHNYVFPTPTAVFPISKMMKSVFMSFPHVRGGLTTGCCGTSQHRYCQRQRRGLKRPARRIFSKKTTPSQPVQCCMMRSRSNLPGFFLRFPVFRYTLQKADSSTLLFSYKTLRYKDI